MAGNWFESGYAPAEREAEKRELGEAPKRWWMRANESKQLVFVDDEPVCFDEHVWRTSDSKFPKSATCLAKVIQEPCPGCSTAAVGRADMMGHMTVVDITGYTTKDGKEVKFELVELCPKTKVLNKLRTKKQHKGSLIGQIYTVTRADDNAPNTGDDFEHLREAKMENLYKIVTFRGKNLSEMIAQANLPGESGAKMRKFLAYNFQIPTEGEIPAAIPAFNYTRIHAPLELPEFKRAIVGAQGYTNSKFGNKTGSGAAGGGAADSEDIPF